MTAIMKTKVDVNRNFFCHVPVVLEANSSRLQPAAINARLGASLLLPSPRKLVSPPAADCPDFHDIAGSADQPAVWLCGNVDARYVVTAMRSTSSAGPGTHGGTGIRASVNSLAPFQLYGTTTASFGTAQARAIGPGTVNLGRRMIMTIPLLLFFSLSCTRPVNCRFNLIIRPDSPMRSIRQTSAGLP